MTTTKRTNFNPTFTITPAVAKDLMRIEAVKQAIRTLPTTPHVLANLRETARLFSTHYSTMIEGNRLTQEQVAQVIRGDQRFPGRERDQGEVRGYYTALDEAERLARRHEGVSEGAVQRLHALVMAGGKTCVKSTPYRDGQNVIRDAHSRGIVYMPPEAKDVPWLMEQLIAWINQKDELPVPVKAGRPLCCRRADQGKRECISRSPPRSNITNWIAYFIGIRIGRLVATRLFGRIGGFHKAFLNPTMTK